MICVPGRGREIGETRALTTESLDGALKTLDSAKCLRRDPHRRTKLRNERPMAVPAAPDDIGHVCALSESGERLSRGRVQRGSVAKPRGEDGFEELELGLEGASRREALPYSCRLAAPQVLERRVALGELRRGDAKQDESAPGRSCAPTECEGSATLRT